MAQGSRESVPSVEMELLPCKVCGRTFVPDRIEYHERVCVAKRKDQREPYDSVSHRWQGTENEPAIKWIKSNSEPKPPRLTNILWRMMERPRPRFFADEEDEDEEELLLDVELTESALPV